ncbi:MAG: 16S rRNA (guanine(966)-N(2))-methyltransferase RsmD [Propionibacteriales bacterium]|nr:16S rRNA (guanine(966)-N(2))-methyltransferase RsmD [Propionibacteriales bacterium]
MTRIIAGRAKGHRLRTPATSDTRPTTDRVREATFSAIADWAGTGGEQAEDMLAGLSFLDLFAGSGAVALEAASRGAGPVTAVESVGAVAAIARDNARTTRLAVTVVAAEAAKWLATSASTRFDVVWADPPYAYDNDRLAAVVALIEQHWLAENGLLVLERASRDDAPVLPEALSVRWHRRYGETTVYYAMKESPC